ncbi:MAG: flagellar protein FlgN [Candidatus Neomarinimicrobiota bacterium]
MNRPITDPDFDKLIELMNEEYAIYQALLNELKRKQKAIVAADVPNLREIIGSEQASIQKTMNYSRKRNEHVRQIMNKHGLTGELTLRQIIDLAPRDNRVRLVHLRDQLKVAVEDIQSINKENRYLLNSSIDFIHGLVNLFLNRENAAPGIYTPSGMLNGVTSTNKMFDYQI